MQSPYKNELCANRRKKEIECIPLESRWMCVQDHVCYLAKCGTRISMYQSYDEIWSTRLQWMFLCCNGAYPRIKGRKTRLEQSRADKISSRIRHRIESQNICVCVRVCVCVQVIVKYRNSKICTHILIYTYAHSVTCHTFLTHALRWKKCSYIRKVYLGSARRGTVAWHQLAWEAQDSESCRE